MKEKSPPHAQQHNNTTSCIINKLKNILAAQHKNLKQYLNLLAEEKKAILKEDMDKISTYIELENKFSETITTCNKTLLTWRTKYESLGRKALTQDIEKMRDSVQKLTEQAYQANEANKALVKKKISAMKKEIAALPFRSYHISSPYKKIGTPNFIDISS